MTVGSSKADADAAAALGAYPQRMLAGHNNYCPVEILIHSLSQLIVRRLVLGEMEKYLNRKSAENNNPLGTP